MLDLNKAAISHANAASQFDAGSALAREAEATYQEGVEKITAALPATPNDDQQAIASSRLAEWKTLVEKAYNDIIAKRAAWMPWTVCGPARYNSEKNNRKADRQMEAAAEWNEKMDRFIENTASRIRDAIPREELLAQYRSGKRRDAISSDDPDALDKLNARIEGMEERQTIRKQRNAWYRKHGTMQGCPGLSAETALQIDAAIENDFYKIPYAPYTLQNANAEMRRLKERRDGILKQREAAAQVEGGKEEISAHGFTVIRNLAEGRVNITFDDKPEADARDILKGHGFHWSPRAQVWTRKLTPAALRDVDRVLSALRALPAYAAQEAAAPLSLEEFAARYAAD